MGTWGASLYANDCTCDVRDTYMKFLQEQLSNNAYQKTIEMHREYIGSEEEPLLWYALADTQWRMGHLMPEVKEKALVWIEITGGISLWNESRSGGSGWKKTLDKLKRQLESPMPPEKINKKPVEFVRNPWNINDVYAYQLNGEKAGEYGLLGKYVLLQKIGDVDWVDGQVQSRVHVFDKIFNQLPAIDDIDGVRILPLVPPENYKPEYKELWDPMQCMNAMMCLYKKSDYQAKYFTFIGNKIGPVNKVISSPYSHLDWKSICDWLVYYHQSWKNRDYVTIGEGQYSYRP